MPRLQQLARVKFLQLLESDHPASADIADAIIKAYTALLDPNRLLKEPIIDHMLANATTTFSHSEIQKVLLEVAEFGADMTRRLIEEWQPVPKERTYKTPPCMITCIGPKTFTATIADDEIYSYRCPISGAIKRLSGKEWREQYLKKD